MKATKKQSFNERHHEESCGLMSMAMSNAGYVSVFQYERPAIESKTVYVLWVSLTEGKQVMAMVSPQGNIDYYDLVENREFKPNHSYDEAEVAAIRQHYGLCGTTENLND